MTNSYKIIRLKLINFAHFSSTLGLNEIEIKPSMENNIVLLIGGNGSGKSLLLSHFTPKTSENTNNRRRICNNEGEEAVKEIDIIRYNQNNLPEYLYKCKIIYNENTTNCSIVQESLITGEQVELNPNGLVSSYEEVLNNVFNLDKRYINITYLSPQITSIVSMNSSNRYNYLSSWLPDISSYMEAYKIITKKINSINKQIKILENDIGAISIENIKQQISFLNSKSISIQKNIDEYKLKRMKLSVVYDNLAPVTRDFLYINIDKIKKNNIVLNNEYNLLLQLDSKSREYRGKNGNNKLINDIHSLEKQVESIHNRLEWVIKSIDEYRLRLKEVEYNLGLLKDTGDSLPETSSLIERIEKSLIEYSNLLKKYENQNIFLLEFDKKYSLNDFNSIESLILFINERYKRIQELIPINSLDLISNKSNLLDNKVKDINDKIKESDIEIQKLFEKISLLKNSPLDNSILDLIPSFCDSDKCGVIKEIRKLLSPDKEISVLQLQVENIYRYKSKLNDELENIEKEISNIYLTITYCNDINHSLQRDKNNIALLPNKLKSILSDSLSVIMINMNNFLRDIEIIKEYLSLRDQYRIYDEELRKLKDKEISLKFIRNMNSDIQNINTSIDSLINEKKKLTEEGFKVLEDINILKEIQISINSIQNRIDDYNNCCLEQQEVYKKMKKICKDWYYREKINRKINEYDITIESLIFDNSKIQSEITSLTTTINTKQSLLDIRDKLLLSVKEMKLLEDVWNPKTGIPSLFIKNFIIKIHTFSNIFLKKLNGNILKISKFEIGKTSRDFSIEIIKEDGTIIPDASQCSEGELSILTLAISLAMLNVIKLSGSYNILRIDELDSHLDNMRRKQFVEMIQEQIEELNSKQCFIISHNNNFDDVKADIILMPGAVYNDQSNNKNILIDLRSIQLDNFDN